MSQVLSSSALPPMKVNPSPRARLAEWVESKGVQQTIVILILVNAVTLGLETAPVVMAQFGGLIHALDRLILLVFVVELVAKLYGHGLAFFRQSWNLFDLLVVTIALVPSAGPLAVLRTLRVLRVLRLVSTLPRLRFIVESLLHAIPGIGAIAGLLSLFFYVCAVISTSLFAERFPDWFGSIGASLYTLFQIMTLESWSMGIVRPVMESYPYAWLFFVPFILLATFTMLNLFIAIIVSTMQNMQAETPPAPAPGTSSGARETSAEEELRLLRSEITELKSLLTAGRERHSG